MPTRLHRVALTGLLILTAPAGAGSQYVSGWRDAHPDRILVFPADHASHPDYRVEWWYYTGHLEAHGGRRFGYQVTFFRVGVDPAPENPSRWTVRDLYITHVAVTDLVERRHYLDERINRAGVGWAGARRDRLEVWNGDWRLQAEGDAHRLDLAGPADRFGLQLRLTPSRPPVLHGRAGYSRKGAGSGNASHYYSITRMPTTGRLVLDGRSIEVTGLSWMDHEFGSSLLEPSQQGWDWFSLQFDDGSDLMLYALRRADGTMHPRSSGTWIGADGESRQLDADGFRLTPGRRWTSPSSGARYPVDWRMDVPVLALQLDVRSLLDDQELDTTRSTGIIYWEGAVDATGTRQGRPLRGRGYLEMTGYAGPPLSAVLGRPAQPPDR